MAFHGIYRIYYKAILRILFENIFGMDVYAGVVDEQA
jgi:hypothetical protein